MAISDAGLLLVRVDASQLLELLLCVSTFHDFRECLARQPQVLIDLGLLNLYWHLFFGLVEFNVKEEAQCLL